MKAQKLKTKNHHECDGFLGMEVVAETSGSGRPPRFGQWQFSKWWGLISALSSSDHYAEKVEIRMPAAAAGAEAEAPLGLVLVYHKGVTRIAEQGNKWVPTAADLGVFGRDEQGFGGVGPAHLRFAEGFVDLYPVDVAIGPLEVDTAEDAISHLDNTVDFDKLRRPD